MSFIPYEHLLMNNCIQTTSLRTLVLEFAESRSYRKLVLLRLTLVVVLLLVPGVHYGAAVRSPAVSYSPTEAKSS